MRFQVMNNFYSLSLIYYKCINLYQFIKSNEVHKKFFLIHFKEYFVFSVKENKKESFYSKVQLSVVLSSILVFAPNNKPYSD